MKEKKRDFLISLGFGFVIAAAVFALSCSRGYPFVHCLCDGFFVAAVMLLGIGGIKAVRNRGAFDVVGYGLRYTLELVIPALRREEKENVYEYSKRKAEERKPARGLLLAGVVYLALSLVTLVLYLTLV